MKVYRWNLTAIVKRCGIVSLLLFIFYLISLPSTRTIRSNSELHAVSKGLHQLYYKHILRNINITKAWLQDQVHICSNNFAAYGHQFARLRNVVFNPDLPLGQFKLVCDQDQLPEYNFLSQTHEVENSHLNVWMKNLETIDSRYRVEKSSLATTLVVFRYEFVNLYHQMTDFYDAFLVMKLLKLNPEKVDIILTDRHSGSLDKIWDNLFGNCTKITEFKEEVYYKDLVWAALGYNSPLNFHSIESIPFVEEFSKFFKLRHEATAKKSLDCDGISILFIWRHDYVSIPGHPKRLISRKVQNEQELISEVQEVFPGHYVAGIQMDQQDMKDQVQWLSQTDILVGMHGAGMSGILSLPSHAGVLELFPSYYSAYNIHFQSMARWRKLHYLRWQNINPTNEYSDSFTYIPAPVITQRLMSLYYAMCHRKPDNSYR